MARAAVRGRLNWTLGEVVELIDETPRVRSIVLEVPEWPGHRAGQHVDVRLTAEDGYQAQRSYSIASAPEDGRVAITVERLPDGEVSDYLVGELRRGDMLELRGPIGGYFVWEARSGGPLLLVAGGSGIVPLMSMLRHRQASDVADGARLIYFRSWDEVIYRRAGTPRRRLDRSRGDPYARPAARMDGVRAPSRRCDARRGGVGGRQHADDVRVRTDLVRRVGRRGLVLRAIHRTP
jgi:ferredoxin-NADP reductase